MHKHGGHGRPGCADHQCDDKCVCHKEGKDPPETMVVRWPPIESFCWYCRGIVVFQSRGCMVVVVVEGRVCVAAAALSAGKLQ